MPITLRSTLLAAGFALMLSPAAFAQSFDNASTHAQARYGNKTCFVSHSHHGESPPWPSKAGAEKAAIRAWTNMTSWEYGKPWGNYKLARDKRLNCSQSGSKWVCTADAYPCRR